MNGFSAHWRYLRTVLRHKWFVVLALYRIGGWRTLPLGLLHDWSKFTPSEWGPYVARFGQRWPDNRPPDDVKHAFSYAWFLHQKRNKHHPTYWQVHDPDAPGGSKCWPMPKRYADELVADWIAAGMAYDGSTSVLPWYAKNRARITLHPETQAYVEHAIGWKGIAR